MPGARPIRKLKELDLWGRLQSARGFSPASDAVKDSQTITGAVQNLSVPLFMIGSIDVAHRYALTLCGDKACEDRACLRNEAAHAIAALVHPSLMAHAS
jgi:hypothetical protein